MRQSILPKRLTWPWTLDNPVVTKELRGRMRGSRTPWLLFGYLLLLSLILFFSYQGWWNSNAQSLQSGGGEAGSAAGYTVGRLFFRVIFYSQAVMIALITPALTAGAISVEREQRTFELLRGTTLRPGAIVGGKLVSSVSFVALLLTSSLPLLSLCFLLGGVSPGEVFFAYVLLIGDAFLFGAIGLCWSAYAASTATATVLSYGTLIAFFAVTFPFTIPTFSGNVGGPNFGLCAVNPIGAVTGAVTPEHYYGLTLPAWVPALLLNGTLTALLVLACVNRLEDFPARRALALRAVTLAFAALLVFFGDGVVLGLPLAFGLPGPQQVTLLLILATALLLLFVPVLVTGDREWAARPGPARPVWSPRRVFGDATLPSGLPLALVLCLVVLGGTWAALHFGAAAGQAPPLRRGFVAPQFGGNAALVARAQSLYAAHWAGLVGQGAVMLGLVVFGISGLGFLLSSLLNNRWSALTLLFLAVILSQSLPFFSYMTLGGEGVREAIRTPGTNSLYLCPFVPLLQMGSANLPGASDYLQNSVLPGLIGYGVLPLWAGTGLVYLILGLACYAASPPFLRAKKSR